MAKKIKTKGNMYVFSNSALSSKQKRKFNLISGIKKIARNIFDKAIIIKDKLVDFNINSDKKAKEFKDKLIAFNVDSDKRAKELFETISEIACTKDIWNLRTVGNNILAKKVFIKHFTVVFVTLTIIFMIVQFGFRPVVVVSIKDQPVAVVPTKKDFEKVLAGVQSKWGRLYSKEIKLNDIPSFSLKVLPKRMISTPTEVANAIEANTNLLIAASGISVNGEVVAVLRDANEAQEALDAIKSKYSSQKAGEEVVFSNEVKVVNTFALPDIMLGASKAVDYLTKNIDADKEYMVKMGDTLWNIAEDNNMAVEKLCELNPQIQDDIYPGQVIKLATPNCLVNVKTIQYLEAKEETPFETKFESDDKGYRGDRKVVAKGKTGKKELTMQLIKQNGVEVGRVILNENVISQPKTEVIAIGTKVRSGSSGASTGIFRVPAFGSVTSRFGFRWGRIHEGIDISGNVGDAIYAADGGTVIFSGAEGGYGNLVKIDHGNGYITYYGHNKKNLVKVGQKISKGAKIAELGSTGNSTGPHVHFQVMKSGSPVDPLKYLR